MYNYLSQYKGNSIVTGVTLLLKCVVIKNTFSNIKAHYSMH